MICPSFLPGETDENFDELLNRMEGYSAADIKCVAERAFDFSFQRHSSQGEKNLFLLLLESIKITLLLDNTNFKKKVKHKN